LPLDRARFPGSECRQEQHHERDTREDYEPGDAPAPPDGPMLRTAMPRCNRARFLAGHRRDANGLLREPQGGAFRLTL
jgi:hypothetical protein